ncbi:transcriptional regulator [Paenibacillus agaridevorans]|uniref:Transcriptional regulator n=1 Tax=Paenibacillus agaridevorans TaxID=171404 RepID=A0A2R5F2X8_9BACL|nr:metalloregulator ArsR/SmtB family transcription factor [Paenibacillus agaridevorans]GBG10703.1 transcriptional regulator [Paenibacillus agaridevorans]
MTYIMVMNEILQAIAEPTRLRIVELLRDGELTVGDIVERLSLNQPQVSKHLRVLQEIGIVTMIPDGNRRICKLRPEPLQQLNAWVGTFRRIWDERLDRLDDYLQEIQEGSDE